MASTLILLILLCILNPFLVVLIHSASFNESCTAGDPPCQALLGYRIPDASRTTLANLSSLFSVPVQDILAANGFSPDADVSVPLSDETLRIMLPCPCVQNRFRNGVGVVNYTIRKNDGLFAISQKFGSFVTFTEIAAANGVADPNLIIEGQNLTIPYPCACQGNMLDDKNVLFMAYVVQEGETSATLSRQYNITASEFERLNPSVRVQTGAVIKLPVESCKAGFNKDATDANLIVPGGGYATTANGCVQCSCVNRQMYCTKSPSAPSTCSLKCASSALEIGNFNTSGQGGRCIVDSCLYDGYRSNTIFTKIQRNTTDDECRDVEAPPPFAYAPEEQGVPEAIAPTAGGAEVPGAGGGAGGGTVPPPPNTTPTTGAPPPASDSTRNHVQVFMMLLLPIILL